MTMRMTLLIAMVCAGLMSTTRMTFGVDAPAAGYTRLAAVSAPKVVDSSKPYPGDRHVANHLVDGDSRTEYSSDGKGTETFVEFDFGVPTPIAAFRHVDRNDPATVATSELIFIDEQGKTIATEPVKHVNQPGGVTSFTLPALVTARKVRWHVTGLGPSGFSTVGGAEITFFKVAGKDAVPSAITIEAKALPVLNKTVTSVYQPIEFTIDNPYLDLDKAVIKIGDITPLDHPLRFGKQSASLGLPPARSEQSLNVVLEVAGKPVAQSQLLQKPVRQAVIYILPHSHVDIGYTELQTDVEKKQMANIARGIELAKATADKPEGARYKWNVEVLWAVESYLRKSSPEKQQEFIDAVKKGWVGLDAMYGNELTGLCRPEELVRLFSYATRLSERCGVPIESAMISDVPGYTWGVVPAMAQCGVKYWSIGPNYFDRMGYTIAEWENKPFYWVGPSGKDKVLCWIPYQGYAISHILRSNLTGKFIFDLMNHLDKTKYPYDLIHLRWSGHGDNAPPDEKIPEFVESWNKQYESPKLAIATTTEAFHEFERRHGDKLPTFSGDWTPYWEDGAGSSARETAMNRASAERLTQTEALYAMLAPSKLPAGEFQDAWRNVLLYSEHTWGAHNSVTEPESKFAKDQWKIKQAFAVDAEKQSMKLLAQVFADAASGSAPASSVDVFNTTSWPRTELVTAPVECAKAGDQVNGPDGKAVASQRLSSGELVFLASDVPAFAAKRYTVVAGKASQQEGAKASGATLDNGLVWVRLDEKTGAIVELKAKGIEGNLVDAKTTALNDYLFVVGDDSGHPQRNGPVKITVKESGPLVASLLVESDAPGCNRLSREVRLVADQDRIELINVVDKKRAAVKGKAGDWSYASRDAKEGVHFGFGFNVPGGVMRMDTPWAVARPETDQLPGACKNWFTVQRWVDVSNDKQGVTWATIDAPMVEVGAITANLLGSQTNPKAWISKLEPSQTLYSWVMNNHWHTNYCAYQDGPTTFRYAIRPHQAFEAEAAARFGTSLSQPLLAMPARGALPVESRLRLEGDGVAVTALKPSDDGKALIVRLFGVAGRNIQAKIAWSDPKPASVSLSDTSEKAIRKIDGPVDVPAWGIVTLRAEFAAAK